MSILRRFRFSIGTVLSLVLTSAAASALFVKIEHYSSTIPAWPTAKYDSPILVILAIGLTAVALGALKKHTAAQTMFQATIAYLGYLSLFWLGEGGQTRLLIYWFQATFALTVAFPLLARRLVRTEMPRGPARTWWKKTFEAVVFAFLNMLLVATGTLIEWIVAAIGSDLFK